MITEKELIASEYKYYKHYHNECCQGLYQKMVRCPEDHSTKKYFINVYVWDFSKYESGREKTFHPEATLYWEDGKSVTLKPHDFRDIREVEMFFEQMYNMFGCCPDTLNN